MGNLKIDFGNTLPLEAKAFSILSKPQSTIVVESLFFLLCDAMYSGPQIFMIYYFPMTVCDYQNYDCGVLSCTVHFDLYMTENVMGVSASSNFLKSDSKRKAQNYIQNFFSKKFREQFYFLTYILPDNVFHESIKVYWQNSHFENMRAGFLKVVKTHFGKLALK